MNAWNKKQQLAIEIVLVLKIDKCHIFTTAQDVSLTAGYLGLSF